MKKGRGSALCSLPTVTSMKKEIRQKAKRTPPAPLLPLETLEIAARREVLIDGVCGIAAYSKELIRIRTKCGFVTVSGASLTLCWSGEKRLLLRGHVQTIAFEPKKRQGGHT